MTLDTLTQSLRSTIRRSPIAWAHACNKTLRPYQVQIARAIKDSILHQRGLTFVIILPRQSGKNELQAHLFAWLLYRYAGVGGRIVSVSPTFKPQTQINMARVKTSLDACLGSRGLWKSSNGYLYQLGQAQVQFFSGEPRANVLGATADLLLSIDEAQSISIAKFDKDFDPMTASTNATRLFWGTAWTADTLLERERRMALQAQQKDGIQRLFYFTADDVRALVPSYALHIATYPCRAWPQPSAGAFPVLRRNHRRPVRHVHSRPPGFDHLSIGFSLSKSAGFGEGRGGAWRGAGLGAGVPPPQFCTSNWGGSG